MEIHALLKERGTKRWVTLEDIVTWCWEQGIPVIHVDKFPSEGRKPDGMAVRTREGHPVIVLCRASKMPAWQIFTLAHELGHIALDHVPVAGAVVDSKLESETEEKEEQEANRFACEVLTGQPDLGLHAAGKMYPNLLAQKAQEFGVRNRISPGVVALNWGFSTKEWATANGALTKLEGKEDAIQIIRKAGAAALDWSALSPDSSEWLERMTGLRPAP